MFNLIKSQWIGIVALVFVAFVLLAPSETVDQVADSLGSSEVTTVSNPHVFSNTMTLSSTLALTGAATFASTLDVTGQVTMRDKVSSLTGSTTLTSTQSNTTIVWNTSGGTTTLPAVATATGTVFHFLVGSALTSTYNAQISSAEGDNIEGSMIVAGAVVDCDASDRIYVLTDGENLGDFVELRSDGQKWFVTQSNALTAGKLLCDG